MLEEARNHEQISSKITTSRLNAVESQFFEELLSGRVGVRGTERLPGGWWEAGNKMHKYAYIHMQEHLDNWVTFLGELI